MKKEHSPSTPENTYPKFGFTESEILFYHITHKPFIEMLQDPQTKIQVVKEPGNAYGEFLFVTISRQGQRSAIANDLLWLGVSGIPRSLVHGGMALVSTLCKFKILHRVD